MEFKRYGKNLYILHGPAVEPNIENEGFMNNSAFIESKMELLIQEEIIMLGKNLGRN